jgi:hypothetical protein
MTLANCGLHGCPPVPLWVSLPMAVIGVAAIVVTLWPRR